jgi:hypothetical protein
LSGIIRSREKTEFDQMGHKAYRGWINLERDLSEVVLAEIHAAAPEQKWQILSAFLGFSDRHFDDRILAITIHPLTRCSSPAAQAAFLMAR